MLSMEELKNRLRKTFRDDYGIQWSDALLDEILYESQREYALYSGGLVGRHKLVSTGSPILSLPEDFFQALHVNTPFGNVIPIVSYRTLSERHGDFRKKRGDKVESICFNITSFGECRIYPQVPEGTIIGTLHYKRLPKTTEWVAESSAAIESYAKFLMYQFLGKKQSRIYYSTFMELIRQEQHRSLGFGGKQIIRTGVYY